MIPTVASTRFGVLTPTVVRPRVSASAVPKAASGPMGTTLLRLAKAVESARMRHVVDGRRLGSAAMAGGVGLIVANVLMLANADARGLESTGDWLVVVVLALAVLLTLA